MSTPSNQDLPPVASDEARRLDGNAAAGILSEVFTHDMTSVQTTCASCGRTGPMGSLMLYGGQVGVVLRCPTCDQVQMRMVHVPERGGQYWMDMRGMSSVRIAPAMSA
jgi:hypothetical protein